MQIKTADIELTVSGSPMRTYVAQPKDPGKYPGIVLFSEIFQLTGPILRSVNRLAGHGFVVAAHEIYHRIEHPGTVIAYDDIGRIRGNHDAYSTAVSQFDADTSAVLDYLSKHDAVAHDAAGAKLGAMGFCIGGHLCLRAALDPRVRASVACYPTGVHSGKLGSDADAGTLARLPTLRGRLLVVFGSNDPHVPSVGRDAVSAALKTYSFPPGVPVPSDPHHRRVLMLPGEHAFMRDEGARFDPAAADEVYLNAVALFGKI